MSSAVMLHRSALVATRSAAGNVESGALRRAFGCFPSGVVALATLTRGGPAGMAVSSFCSVSLDPPLVSLCVRNESSTWPVLRDSPRLGLSVLGADQGQVCRRLAGRSVERFEGVSWEVGEDGAVFVHGAVCWMECSLHDVLPGGDHAVALLRVERHAANSGMPPLLFHGGRLRSL